jgi:uncharacterized damage-inducible protein DinB
VAERYVPPEGTLPLLAGVLYALDFAHADMMAIVRDLPSEALVWQPGAAMGTLSGIVRHTLYCEEYAFRAAAGEDARYDREANAAQWEARDDAPTLVAAIAACDALAKRLLPPLTVDAMAREMEVWGGPQIETAGTLIADALAHTTMHWGHMQMTRQQWTQTHPEFTDTYEPW